MPTNFDPPLNTNPSDANSLRNAMRFVMGSFAKELDGCLPAIVQDYDPVKNIATVRPVIAYTLRKGNEKVPRMEIVGVPVLSLGAGGFHIHMPLKAGDLGWIYAADRDTSLFMQSLTEQAANTARSHSFVDGVFIPDVFRNYTLQEEDTDAMVLQSTDGATRISIRPDNIKITASSNVTIDAPQVHILHDAIIEGTVDAKSTVHATGKMSGDSGLAITGSSDFSGEVNITGTLKVNGISVNLHKHLSAAPGSPTGPMMP